jgi:SAM-dependent MidA family methyltransferase
MIYEISPKQDEILRIIFKNISKNGGLLILDYAKISGGAGNTMQAISSHKKRSIFHEPGNTDLTSLIDIKRYQEIARTMNINSFGPINQSDFLLSLGVFERYKILRSNASDEYKNKLDRQYHRLTDPDKMGKLFKVVYFSNNKSTAPEKMK